MNVTLTIHMDHVKPGDWIRCYDDNGALVMLLSVHPLEEADGISTKRVVRSAPLFPQRVANALVILDDALMNLSRISLRGVTRRRFWTSS